MANGQPWQSNGAKQVLARLAEHPLWKNRAEWAKSGSKDGHGLRGTGLAVGGWIAGLQPTGATVRLNPDGSLSVLTGQVDIAGTNIALAQIAASAYGVDIDKVRITTGDTDMAPDDRAQRGQQDDLHGGRRGAARRRRTRGGRRSRSPPRELEASVDDLEIVDGQRRGARRAGSVDHAGPDRQEGQPLHVEDAAGARREPSGLRAAGARPSRPSSRGSRSIPTPAR